MGRSASRRLVILWLVGGLVVAPSLAHPGGTAAQSDRVTRKTETVRPGGYVRWSRLPRAPRRAPRVYPRFSDIEPARLRQMKRRVTGPGAPAQVASSPVARGPRATEQPLAPTRLFSFEGPSQAGNAAFGFLARPPDPDIAAGPNHVGAVVNSHITFYTKGGVQVSQADMAAWFDAALCSPSMSCDPFDPRITYDPVANRWIWVALHLDTSTTTNRVLVSVSTSSDPTGSWCNYSINGVIFWATTGDDTWADYPGLGIDGIASGAGGAIYVTANQFTFSPFGIFRTSSLRVIPKSQAYACSALTVTTFTDIQNADGSQAFTLRPAKTYGNPGVEFMVNTRNGNNFVTLWSVDPVALTVTRQATITIGSYGVPPDAAQPGCSDLLDTIDNRMYNAVWRNNRIYAAFSESSSGGLSNIRYLKINTVSNSAEINTSFGTASTFYFMPAITVDPLENIYLVFAASGTGMFGSVLHTGQRLGAALEAAEVVRSGVQCIPSSPAGGTARWGDYFGAAVDVINPPTRRVWIIGEWAADLSGIASEWDWSTQIARVQFGVITTVGLFDGATSTFFLRNSNSAGVADLTFVYGPAGAGWIPVFGDWDGDGIESIGLFNPTTSTFFLKNTNAAGSADLTFVYGPAGAGWTPLAGDWNGDGVDTIGLFSPATNTFFLKNTNAAGPADLTFTYGPAGAGWTPVIGDWNGDGVDTVGLFNPATSTWFLKNANAAGSADLTFTYGPAGAGWQPRVGDWSGDNTDTVGLFNGDTSTWFLKNTNAAGSADLTFTYGPAGAGWTPGTGDWDGL